MKTDKQKLRNAERRIRVARDELMHLFIMRLPGRKTLTYRCIKRTLLALGPHKSLPRSWFGADKNQTFEAPVF